MEQTCITCSMSMVANVATRFCSTCRKKWTSEDRNLLVDAHMKSLGKKPKLVDAYMKSLGERLVGHSSGAVWVDTGEPEELIIDHGSAKNPVNTWAEATKVKKLLEDVDLNKEWFLDEGAGVPIQEVIKIKETDE